MDNVGFMCGMQRDRGFTGPFGGFAWLSRSISVKTIGQRATIDVLHNQVRRSLLGDRDVMNGDDIVVLDSSNGTSLSAQRPATAAASGSAAPWRSSVTMIAVMPTVRCSALRWRSVSR